MFGRVLSALFTFAGWAFKGVMAKFFIFFALYYVTTEFIPVLTDLLPNGQSVQLAFASMPPEFWYFIDLFMLDFGIPACISAYVTRFTIRRIPIIG